MPKDQRKLEAKYIKPMMEDKLFLRTGIESRSFEVIFNDLNLTEDSEY